LAKSNCLWPRTSQQIHITRNQRLYFLKSEINWVIGGKQNSKSEIEIKANEYLSKTDCINRQSNVKIVKWKIIYTYVSIAVKSTNPIDDRNKVLQQ
jgi:hypothetical protein